jgi:hypothetical protein
MNPDDVYCSVCGRYHASLTVCPSFKSNMTKTYFVDTASDIAQSKREAQAIKVDYEKFYNDVKIHFEMLCTDEIRAHAYADVTHDLAFQVFRVLGGYGKALEEKADGIAQGRREAADIVVKFLNSWAPRPRSHDELMADLRETILGTASDEKTDKGEIDEK